ncbi:flagellar protein FliT [Chitinilyticum litopenaei]|uniref:flagellar protein FliT n=1 Tax=Chitinilyticum litopenaei TaxID=1121276 RepID=UPI0004202734|nr:flagellar protein FliT [Chitinilyticum litopenaei]
MAKPDIVHTLRAFNVLARQMLADAEQQNWEALLERQPIWLTLQDALHDIPWHEYDEAGRQQLVQLITQLQASIAELTAHAQAWRPELLQMIQSLQNSSRLDRTYRP